MIFVVILLVAISCYVVMVATGLLHYIDAGRLGMQVMQIKLALLLLLKLLSRVPVMFSFYF